MVAPEAHTQNKTKHKNSNLNFQDIKQINAKLNILYLLLLISFVVQISTIVFFFNLLQTNLTKESEPFFKKPVKIAPILPIHIESAKSELVKSKPIVNENYSKVRHKRQLDGEKTDLFDNAVPQTPHVDFVSPAVKQEFKEKEKEVQNGTHNNPWVWLTSYSRIPVSIRPIVFFFFYLFLDKSFWVLT